MARTDGFSAMKPLNESASSWMTSVPVQSTGGSAGGGVGGLKQNPSEYKFNWNAKKFVRIKSMIEFDRQTFRLKMNQQLCYTLYLGKKSRQLTKID